MKNTLRILTINKNARQNVQALPLYALGIPLGLASLLIIWLLANASLSQEGYIRIQEKAFFYLNGILSRQPALEYNLTQLGDASVMLSFLTAGIVFCPVLWRSLTTGLLLSGIFSPLLKSFFSVPRPAAVYSHEKITIIGKTLMGHTSLPSGHTITAFTILCTVCIVFFPKNTMGRIVWVLGFLLAGYFISLSRVAVGAHHPLDVVIGSFTGIFCSLCGILINQKIRIWNWMGSWRSYPFFAGLILACLVSLVMKIFREPLPVYFAAVFSLLIALFLLIRFYVEKTDFTQNAHG